MNSDPAEMKNNRKIKESLPDLIILILIFSSAFYFLSVITSDPDLWGHLRFGKDLWETSRLPFTDSYSYTAYGQTWINHEWFSELMMYLIFSWTGSAGLLFSKLLIGFLIVFIILRITLNRSGISLISAVVLITSIFIISPGFMTRPQVVTFLFTACFLMVFHLYLERKTNLLWLLPLIMVIWVNSHGGFIVGIGLLIFVTASELILYIVKGTELIRLRKLIFWTVLTCASMLINPYDVGLFHFLFKSLSVSREISEWGGINILDGSYIRFKIFAVLVLISFLIDKKHNRLWEVSIILVALVYAFLHQRHTVILGIIAAPFLCEKLNLFISRLKLSGKIGAPGKNPFVLVMMSILVLFHVINTFSLYLNSRCKIFVDPRIYPVSAVSFLKENKIAGNVMLPFEWGEYVIWHLYPDCRVSIDGRFRTVYSQEIIDDHFEAGAGFEGWKELIKKYPPEIILARRNHISEWFINKSDGWIYVYSDPAAIIFIRDKNNSIKDFNRDLYTYPGSEPSIYFP